MGKVDFFSIILSKENHIFFAGETLEGIISFRIRDRFKINGVKLRVYGEAKVDWSGPAGRISDRSNEYRAEEILIDEVHMIVTKEPDSDPDADLYLEAGNHSYPFSVDLPSNLPTSFEHENGQIRYFVNGTIELLWAMDKNTKRTFTVINQLNLNAYPRLRHSCYETAEKVFSCWPYKSEPIIANFSLSKTGFVPGEPISFYAEIENKSNRKIHEAAVYLIQKIKFRAKNKTNICYRTVEQIKYPTTIPKRSIEKWDDAVLLIPSCCTSSNGSCKIIDVSYLVLFNYYGAGPRVNKGIAVPIVIGTIPLVSKLGSGNTQLNPTYESCVFGSNTLNIPSLNYNGQNRTELYESNNGGFTPMYPYFKGYSVNNYYY